MIVVLTTGTGLELEWWRGAAPLRGEFRQEYPATVEEAFADVPDGAGVDCEWCAREEPCECGPGRCRCSCAKCMWPFPLPDDGPGR
jgi:hypothetical protein